MFACSLEGRGLFDEESGEVVDSEHLVLFRDGERARVEARDQALRFLLIPGKPIGEPVAWWSPIVMNTRQEVETAVEQYQEDRFIRHRGPPGEDSR